MKDVENLLKEKVEQYNTIDQKAHQSQQQLNDLEKAREQVRGQVLLLQEQLQQETNNGQIKDAEVVETSLESE